MKNLSLLFILILILFSISLTEQNWFWQNPLPQGNDLKDVWVLDQNTIFAVGDRGTLLRSTNTGIDWDVTLKLAGIYEDIIDIHFIDDQKGWLLATNIQDYYSDVSQETSTIFSTTDIYSANTTQYCEWGCDEEYHMCTPPPFTKKGAMPCEALAWS